MAVIWQFWVEGHDDAETAALSKHFQGLVTPCLAGDELAWSASRSPASPGLEIWSPNAPQGRAATVADAVTLTEAGLRLFAHLKSGPPFRFAHAGWEASLVTGAELAEYVTVTSAGSWLSLECALSESEWQALGSPQHFIPFSDKHVWHPYWGEKYAPLGALDQRDLTDLCRALFPMGQFKY